jgi:actin-related protein
MKLDITVIVITNVISVILGALIGEPLKKIVLGEYKSTRLLKKKERQKKMIIEYFRDEYCYDPYQSESTEEIKDKLFPNLKLEEVYDLLKELETEGKMRSVTFDQTIMATIDWRCNLF